MKQLLVLFWCGMIGYIFFPVNSNAQIGATDNFYPVIDTIPLGNNQYRFVVRWPKTPVDTNAYTNPPKPLSQATQDFLGIDLNNQQPQWKYFWEFGDGFFSRDSSPVHIYELDKNYAVKLRLTPIYSRNDEPTIIRGNGDTVRINQRLLAGPNQSNFPDNSTSPVQLAANWNAARTTDTITCAVSFRNVFDAPRAGVIRLKLPKNGISIIEDRIPFEDITFDTQSETDSLILSWQFDTLDFNEERTIFLDFRVDSDITVEDSDNFDVVSKVIWDGDIPPPPKDPILNVLLGVTSLDRQGSVVGVENEDVEPITIEGVNADTENFLVSRARDPNSIEVFPKIIPPGKKTHQLRYRINFENLGKAEVDLVTLRSFLEKQHDPGTLQGSGFAFSPVSSTLAGPDFPDGPNEPIWSLANASGVVFPGEGGFVEYAINTDDKRFNEGDKIRGQALITLGTDDTLLTNLAFVKVVNNDLKLPWMWGLKFGGNNQESDFSTGLGEGGYHFGLTLRKALGRLDRQYQAVRRFPASALPSFWYQIEFMGNNLKTTDSAAGANQITFDYWFAELAPLQLRYFPDLNAGPFQKGFLGISGGYKAAYLLNASINDQEQTINQGFVDRIEHNVFLEASILNNLGRPGLSIGYRLNWRLNKVFSRDPVDQYYQLFLHLNL